MAGERLDLSSDSPVEQSGSGSTKRRFLGVRFACCGVYARIYINHDETAYVGRCPRCLRPVRFEIGEGGTDCRFFTAY